MQLISNFSLDPSKCVWLVTMALGVASYRGLVGVVSVCGISVNYDQVTTPTLLSSDLITSSRKHLKLLLMPLIRSAVKEKSHQVEEARLRAWWHLIIALGNSRPTHFKQVRGREVKGQSVTRGVIAL